MDATSEHSRNHVLKLACAAVAVRSTGDRAWTFVLPLFLSEASPSSLVPVSLLSLSLSLSVVLLGPPLAQWLATHRSPSRALTLLVIVENIAVVLGGAAVVAAARSASGGAEGEVVRQPLFCLGLLLLAVDAAVTSVLSLLIEKDVIARLFLLAPSQPAATSRKATTLAEANAAVTRADLAASVGTYLVLGYAVKGGSGAHLIAYLGAWHAVAGVLVLVLLGRLRAAAPELALGQASDATPGASSGEPRGGKARRGEGPSEPSGPREHSEPSRPGFVRLLLDGPRTLAQLERRARLLLCAFVCLFFTVLSPSGLLTASLRSRGTSAHANPSPSPNPNPSPSPSPNPNPSPSPSPNPHRNPHPNPTLTLALTRHERARPRPLPRGRAARWRGGHGGRPAAHRAARPSRGGAAPAAGATRVRVRRDRRVRVSAAAVAGGGRDAAEPRDRRHGRRGCLARRPVGL